MSTDREASQHAPHGRRRQVRESMERAWFSIDLVNRPSFLVGFKRKLIYGILLLPSLVLLVAWCVTLALAILTSAVGLMFSWVSKAIGATILSLWGRKEDADKVMGRKRFRPLPAYAKRLGNRITRFDPPSNGTGA